MIMIEEKSADTGVTSEACGYGRCVKGHSLQCCHTSVTRRRPLGRGRVWADEIWYQCVFCGKPSRTRTVFRVDRNQDILLAEEA